MKNPKNTLSDLTILRSEAEKSYLHTKAKTASATLPADVNRLIHELEVHQIELEMQNEQLKLAIEQSETASRKYSELYDLSPTGYITLARDGSIAELNLSGAQMLGKAQPSLINRLFAFFISADSKPVFRLFLNKIFSHHNKETCEIILDCLDKPPMAVYLTGNIAGNDEQCLLSLVDITGRKQIEKALRISEDQSRSVILQTAMDGFWLLDLQGRLLEVNDTYCRMCGYNKQELSAMDLSMLEVDETAEDIASHIEKVISKGEDRFETRHRRKDGSVFDVEISVQYQAIHGGRFVAFLHDITDRKKAEEALIESEQRYRSLFEASNDAIFLVDLASGRYMDCNPLAEKLTGYSHEEILLMKTGTLLPPPYKPEIESNIEAIISGKVLRKETEIITKSGKLIPVEFNSSLLTIKSKNYILSMLHDISERRAADEALKQSEQSVRVKLQSILSPEGSIADLELKDIIDAESIQNLMRNFYELAQIPVAIIDVKGKILVGVGWQDICNRFHRVHPQSCKNCIESDLHLTRGIPEGEFRLYKCKNNMWDMATPINIGGEHKGNLFMGQFFIDDEPINYPLFRKQAGKYGFEEQEYIDALDKAPRISNQKLEYAKAFFLDLSYSISQLSYSNIKLARAISQQKIIEDELREKDDLLNKAEEIAHLGSWSLDLVTNRLTWSDEIYRIFGLQVHEFAPTYEGFLDAIHPEDRDMVHSAYTGSVLEGKSNYEIEHRIISKHSGELRYVVEKCEHIKDDSGKIVRSVGMVHDITEKRLFEEALSENERLLRESQAVAHIGSYAANLMNKTWKASPEIYEIFGIDENYPHTMEGWAARIHPDFREELVNDLFQVQTDRKLFSHEYKIIRLHDGAERWIHGLGKFEYGDTQHSLRLIGTIQDITERKAKEHALYKLNRTLKALSKSSQAMSHSVNEEDYLQKVCKIVVDDTDFAMIWIGYAEDDEAKTVRPVASAGFTNDYIETIKVSWDDSALGRGPTGTAIRTGKLSKCNNMLTDPSFEPWRKQAIKQGFASSVVFPLKSGDKTFGAITIYSDVPDSFLEDEISMLGELANDLANGITTIRLQATHKLAEEALSRSHNQLEVLVKERTRELSITNELLNKEINIRKQKEQSLKSAEEKYRTVADYTYNWEYWIAPDGTIQYMSPSVERITGYTIDEFIENPLSHENIIFEDDKKLWEKHTKDSGKLFVNDKNDDFKFRIVTKSGEIRWIGHTCRKIYNNGKYLGVRVSNQDITEKVKAENELLNITVKVEENERNRISRELHDGLGPLLSTIKLYFQWLAETNDPQKIKIITEKGNQSIDRAIHTTREVSHGLSSQVLTHYGYVGAVLEFTQSINDTKKLDISFNPNCNERFSSLLEITLYRITTELVNNTLNYASATHVEIDFDFYEDKNLICFTYTDNGIGFDAADIKKAGKGMGLMNIKQRIKLVQGIMNIETGIGKGLKVQIDLPIINTIV